MAKRRKEKLRVPNPKRTGTGRLDAPPGRAHGSKKKYRRRPKHPDREGERAND